VRVVEPDAGARVSGSGAVRVALVTGASRGIGRAIAARLAADGFRVAGTATSSRSFDASAPLALPLALDVSAPAAVGDAVARVVAELGRLDVVVNNAGIAGSNSLDEPPGEGDELWHRILDVDLNGPYYVAKAALPHLPDRSGRIVNVGSVLSLMGVADQSAYTAAKHGLLGLTRALADLLAPRGITCNLVAPGWVETDMARARWEELGTTKERIASKAPTGRIMVPEDVAAAVGFLVREDSAGVNGQVVTVDGGTLQY